tara:strand:- start:5087 stop:5233 length:147 start_codon:yes stop_codon:yes gene_type:complete
MPVLIDQNDIIHLVQIHIELELLIKRKKANNKAGTFFHDVYTVLDYVP